MREYVKPAIVVNEDLAESVYMASGSADVAGGASDVSVNASISGNNGSDTVYFNESILVTNNSDTDIVNWSVSLAFSGPVKAAQVYNCNVAISGSVITITPAYDWNNTLRAYETYKVGAQVTGDTILTLA